MAAKRREGTPGFFFHFFGALFCSLHATLLAGSCTEVHSTEAPFSALEAGPDRLPRMCEKDLGENICNQGINALRTSPSPLILQEAPPGLGRAEQRWRNARKRATAKAGQPGVKGSVGCGGTLRFFASYLRQAPKFRLQPPRHIVSPALRQAATAAARLKLILWDVIASSI